VRQGFALNPFQAVDRVRVVPYKPDKPVSTGDCMGSGRNYQLLTPLGQKLIVTT